MSVWLVRHAQPLVPGGVCYGVTDLAADPADTRRAAAALAQTLPQRAAVITSPLQRCEQLAQCLRGLRSDLTLATEPRLIEMNFGCWEGQRWDAIAGAAFDRWMANFGSHAFGGVECVDALMQRVAALWDEAGQAAGEQVWITHAGVIRAATLIAGGQRQITQASQWPRDALGFGECRVLMAGRMAAPGAALPAQHGVA